MRADVATAARTTQYRPDLKANRMRLACPSCQATYDVPDDRLGTGTRRLRCACCAHEWTFVPSAPAAASPPPPPPTLPGPAAPLAAEPRLARAPSFPPYDAPPARRRGALAAWAVSILVLAGLGFAAVQFRAGIMSGWPPSQRVYAVFGMGPH